ncbi:hypothetical protein D3C87_1426580 [compost metagenome]
MRLQETNDLRSIEPNISKAVRISFVFVLSIATRNFIYLRPFVELASSKRLFIAVNPAGHMNQHVQRFGSCCIAYFGAPRLSPIEPAWTTTGCVSVVKVLVERCGST